MAKQTAAEAKLSELFDAAHKDRHLKLRLLSEPKAVAKEWGVELGAPEVDRLEKLGAFVELAHEAKAGRLFRYCDPRVCYPSTVWLRAEVLELVRDLIIFYPPRHIFYPPPILRAGLEERLRHNLGPIEGVGR